MLSMMDHKKYGFIDKFCTFFRKDILPIFVAEFRLALDIGGLNSFDSLMSRAILFHSQQMELLASLILPRCFFFFFIIAMNCKNRDYRKFGNI